MDRKCFICGVDYGIGENQIRRFLFLSFIGGKHRQHRLAAFPDIKVRRRVQPLPSKMRVLFVLLLVLPQVLLFLERRLLPGTVHRLGQ